MFSLKSIFAAAIVLAGAAGVANAGSDLVTKRSAHPFVMTLDRLEAAAKENGLVVFTRLDHAAAAKAAGLEMPPATVLVVGNPKAGTPQFLEHPTLGIDLPLKILVWQSKTGEVSVSYNSAVFTTATLERHGFDSASEAMLKQAKGTEAKLEAVAEAAVK